MHSLTIPGMGQQVIDGPLIVNMLPIPLLSDEPRAALRLVRQPVEAVTPQSRVTVPARELGRQPMDGHVAGPGQRTARTELAGSEQRMSCTGHLRDERCVGFELHFVVAE